MNTKQYFIVIGLGILGFMFLTNLRSLLDSIIFDFHFIDDHWIREIIRKYVPVLLVITLIIIYYRKLIAVKEVPNFKKTFILFFGLYLLVVVLHTAFPFFQQLYQNENYWRVKGEYVEAIRGPTLTSSLIFGLIPNLLVTVTIVILCFRLIWKNSS